jgi:hypothetical protein
VTDTARQILTTYGQLKLHQGNEAETRLKVIDRIIFGVLGWTLDDVSVEEHVSEDGTATYADYVIKTGMTALVVEAKKVGVAFDGVPNVRRAQLNRKFVSGVTGDAITQARDYARKLGVPFAAVTNGSCWIVFPASRVDQVSFSDSAAVIFPSLNSVLENDFAEFYDLLSRQAVISGGLESELLGRLENQIEERRLNRFYTKGFSRLSRQSLFPLIEDAVTTAFSEDIVAEDSVLLEKCYVQTPDRMRFDRRISMHIGKRETVFNRPARRPMRDKDSSALKDIIGTAAARAKPVAVLVLGSVGAGKTTFLEYTHKVVAREQFQADPARPYPHWIRIDFLDFASSASPIDFLTSQLKEHINQDPFLSDYSRCIQHAYKAEIDSLFKGPLFLLADDPAERKKRTSALIESDYLKTSPYVEKVLGYAAQRSPVFLVVDNVDQHEEEGVQSAIFSDAMALAHKLKLNLVCALRESTYVQHRDSPTFNAFDFDAMVIDPPDVHSVLSKRFFLARQLLSGQSGRFRAESGADVHISDLSTIIDLLQPSVLGTEIGNMIGVLATGDIRLALRMVREFLQSGYSASGRALQTYQRKGSYVMPQHEALRAIILGNQAVYAERLSVIGNPFDARLHRTEVQLLRLYILSALVQFSSTQNFQGFAGSEIQKAVREIGYGDDMTLKTLADLCRMRFILTTSHKAASLEASYIPTRLGGYIIRNLLSNFTFIENIMMDTFISDSRIWNDLRDMTDSIYSERDPIPKLHRRKARAELFFQYMKRSYAPLRTESLRRGLESQWCASPMEAAEGQFMENLKRATRSAERNYGTPEPLS